ncbi:glycoside hydrolase family 97 N-terminal domain-containing protein [Spirosoma fluminis]
MVAHSCKRYVLVPLLVLYGMAYGAPRPFQRTITSPNGRITLVVAITDSVRLSVRHDRQQLIHPSTIAMALADGRVLGVGTQPQRSQIRIVRDSILAPVATKRRVVADQYTELRLTFRDQYTLEFRAYNDGVAYRFSTLFPDSITIRNETARFTFADNPTVYYPAVQPRPGVDRFHTSFEEPYQIRSLSEIADTALCFSPVLVAPASGPRIVLTESDLLDYPGMFLARQGASLTGVFAQYPLAERLMPGEFPQWVVSQRADFIARTTGTRTFP